MVTHHLANEWTRQGHAVRVFHGMRLQAAHPEARYQATRFAVMRGSRRFGYHRFPWLPISVASLQYQLSRFQPDFVSGQFAYPTGIFLAGLPRPVPFLLTCHGADVLKDQAGCDRDRYRIDRPLQRSLRRAKAVIALSSAARQALAGLGLAPNRIVTVPNGVDVERFRRPVPLDLRAGLGWPREAQVVLTVGRNHPQKNLALGLQVMAQAMQRNPRLRYLLVGCGVTRLEAAVAARQLSGRIALRECLVGDELVNAYQQATLFLSTSQWELCPLVILEAMAAGLPQVATDVPGTRDYLEHDRTGLLIDGQTPEALVEAVLGLVEDDSRRRAFAEAGQAKAASFAWDRISEQYLALARS